MLTCNLSIFKKASLKVIVSGRVTLQLLSPLQNFDNQSHETWFLVSFQLFFSIADILGAVPTLRARDRTVVTAADAGTGFSENAIIYLLLLGVGPRTNLS